MNALYILLPTVFAFKYIPEDNAPSYMLNSYTAQKHIAKAEDIPYHAAVAYGTLYCSGALVHSHVVVTTASCFVKRKENENVLVKVGASTLPGPGQVVVVEEVKIHEYYQHASAAHNDIALLGLQKGVKFGPNVKTINIVEPEIALRSGTTIAISGWGFKNLPPKYFENLVWSEMVVIEREECEQYYGNLITPSNFCAKYPVERRISDNGGPAVYRMLLMGLLSFGGTSKEEPHIAVFTNASYFHRWIALNSRRFTEKNCDINPSWSIDDDYSSDKFS